MHTNLEIKTKTHCKGGGGQKSGVLDRGPRGNTARIFAKFRKTFLLMVDAQDSSAAGAASTSMTTFMSSRYRKNCLPRRRSTFGQMLSADSWCRLM
jgi:hypothetical protein